MDINIGFYVILPGLVGAIPYLAQRFNVGRAVAEALEEAHVTQKEAADWMGISVPQLSRELSGSGPEHLSFNLCTRLPNRVWWRLLPKLAVCSGVPVPAADDRAKRDTKAAMSAVRARLWREREEVHA